MSRQISIVPRAYTKLFHWRYWDPSRSIVDVASGHVEVVCDSSASHIKMWLPLMAERSACPRLARMNRGGGWKFDVLSLDGT